MDISTAGKRKGRKGEVMQPVVLYTTTSCIYCRSAKAWFSERGVPYTEVDVTDDDAARAALVERSGGQRTVPQIFVGDTHVGGYSDLVALDAAGKFTPLLEARAP
jgi:glutaredoxin 3